MELRKPNGDYTESGLQYPGMTADIELCKTYLNELCQIVWAGNPNRPANMVMWSIPPRPDNFDMQLSAALDELKAYRATGLSPERVAELAEAEKDGRLLVWPCKVGDTVYKVDFGDGYSEPQIIERIIRRYKHTAYSPYPLCDIELFNKTVFLTRAEAEIALERRGAEL